MQKIISIPDDCENPFKISELTKLQDFYGLRYEDFSNEKIMKDKWVTDNHINFIKNNKDKLYAYKSTKSIESRQGLFEEQRFKALQSFFGFSYTDIQDINTLKSLWMPDNDIEYIFWDKYDKKNVVEASWKVVLTAEYEKVFNAKVPINKKNDVEWMQKKILEVKK